MTVVAWPVMLLFEIWTTVANRRKSEAFKSPPVFEVKKGDSVESLTQAQIEAWELVTDPLSASPPLPFSHLYAAWENFLENVKPEDAL